MVTTGNQALMQTAMAKIKNIAGNSLLSTRIILDSGSQRTYITEKLVKSLHLVLRPPERLTVATFGSDKLKHIKYRSTELQLVLRDGNVLRLEASVVPHITGKIAEHL